RRRTVERVPPFPTAYDTNRFMRRHPVAASGMTLVAGDDHSLADRPCGFVQRDEAGGIETIVIRDQKSSCLHDFEITDNVAGVNAGEQRHHAAAHRAAETHRVPAIFFRVYSCEM